MSLYDILLSDYKLHRKTRTRKHPAYPVRFMVPDDKVSWKYEYPEYAPVEFNSSKVLDKNTTWADPQDITQVKHPFTSFEGNIKFSKNGRPLNPFGRTGMTGRGLLGKWGANFATDGVITTLHPQTHLFQVLAIIRKDTGEMAFPGGMVDPGEEVWETRDRELNEELSISKADLSNSLYEDIAFRGYVDDPRNTDNAWMETTVIHTHIAYNIAMNMSLSAGDDATSYKWTEVTGENINHFYANHGLSLLAAIKKLISNDHPFIAKEAVSIFNQIV